MRTKRILSMLLTVAMLLTTAATLKFAPVTVNAAGETSIEAGVPSGLAVGDKVYYGVYPQSTYTPLQTPSSPVDGETYTDTDGTAFMYKDGGYYKVEPIEWRILQNADGKLFLLSEKNLDAGKQYNTTYTNVTWETSTIRAWLNGYTANQAGASAVNPHDYSFIDWAFSGKEQTAIATTNVLNPDNPTYGTSGGNTTYDKIFLLSIQEAANSSYGFTDNYSATDTRIAVNTGYTAHFSGMYSAGTADFWWLRSPGDYSYSAAVVYDNGIVYDYGYSVDYDDFAARPAFNLDLTSVLFTSAAAGGKSSATAGSGLIPAEPVGANMKFTILDDSLTLGSVTRTSAVGSTVNFSYTGATAGKTLSAVVLDENGEVKYYGKLADNITANGNASVTLPNDIADTDTVQIFVEECNGDYYTDFAGAFVELDIPDADLEGAVSISGDAAYGKTLTADTNGITSTPPLGTLLYQWKRGGADISGATDSTYTVTSADIGQTITVTVSAANYWNSLTSPGVTAGKGTQDTLTVVGGNVTKIYGDGGFQLTTTGGSGTGAVTWNSNNACVSVDNSGNVTINGAGTATVTVAKAGDGNYDPSQASIVITVGKKTLNVYVQSEQRAYGEENPAFTVTYDGFITGEDENDLTTKPTAACTADASTPVSSVPIVLSGGASGNYEFAYNNGTLVINKAGNTTFALNGGLNVSKTYGNDIFTLDTTDAKGTVTFESKNTAVATVTDDGEVTIIGAGEAQIYAYDAGDSNYEPATAAITVTVAKKAITVTADDKEKYYGAADPALTWTAQPALVTGDTLTGSLKYTGSAVGSYDIVEDTAFANPNYDITFVQGTMTVKNTPTMDEVIDKINNLPDPDDIKTTNDADKVAEATNAFDALPEDVKEQIPDDVKEKLEDAQKKAGEINIKDGDVALSAPSLPWYVRIVATPIPESDSRYSGFFDKLTDKKLAALYDIKLINTLTGEEYELPTGETVTVEIGVMEMTGLENVTIAHEKKDGTIEYITATVKDSKVTFTANGFSLYGVVANADKTDPVTPVPGTGDNSNMTLWLLLGGAALTVLGGMVVMGRKRRKYRAVSK